MKSAHFRLEDGMGPLREKLHRYAAMSQYCTYLDSHSDKDAIIPLSGTNYEILAAAGAKEVLSTSAEGLDAMDAFITRHKGNWIFGHLGYDLKNGIEKLTTRHAGSIGFADLCLFVPQTVVAVRDEVATVYSVDDPERIWRQIMSTPVTFHQDIQPVPLQSRMTASHYLDKVGKTIQHILQGDIYEMNYCHEYFAQHVDLDPVAVAGALFRNSPNPFSCYYRNGDRHLMCASPGKVSDEAGRQIDISTNKGTARRGAHAAEDHQLHEMLKNDAKERSENVMIVDLVRNDLSRVAVKGSVHVEELFGVYTFPGAHQMISTIGCSVPESVSFTEMVRATFPMGSMTGAPKIRAMQLIDELEESRRGLFSGSVGYMSPDGDFDFNVVIRSIQYDAQLRYVSVMAGGAITAGSDPYREYEETLVKLGPQFKVLGFDPVKVLTSHA